MGIGRISTGNQVFDMLLCGGYENDVVSTLYGPAGTGKTTLCLLSLINMIKSGKKVIYIDTEGGFSISRLEQLEPDIRPILENILFFKPTSFEEQKKSFESLRGMIDERIGLIIVDSISMLYRIEMGKKEDISQVNRELGGMIALLTEITRKNNIPVLITNQVYSSFDVPDKVNMVGGDILKYGSKCLVELQLGHRNRRRAVLRKHRSLPSEKEEVFEILNEGVFDIEKIEKKEI